MKSIGAPLERCRIIKQTLHMQNLKVNEKPTGSSISILQKITSEQGVAQLWRGNMANVYKVFLQMSLKVFFYDKFKNFWMPFSTQKYTGFDYIWRVALSGSLCTAITTFITYPLDLIHTRLVTDMSKQGQQRLFKTTFDCFNRTHLDEGRGGLFKGLDVTIYSAILRGALTLPIYDLLKRNKVFQSKEGEINSLASNFLQRLGPSMISSLLISMILYPMDTMKRCLQLNGGRGQLILYKGFGDATSKFLQSQGPAGLYRGIHLYFINELVMAFTYISIYEAMGPKNFGLE
ncbi:adp atp translocase 3 [Stylonychia lemnae]|uniref:Adp atp translocase 3 n=1 Tax=Stylonychia lemnae TaxID=5949 RepID=A0A078AER7_STYLE|nr:adp atp translocase 3 [Stylonychia lemnae]|eukprot:CDW80725.1 adp atp translocase 3 [Stylonychia lemnae]